MTGSQLIWTFVLVVGFMTVLGFLLRRPTTRSARSVVFVAGTSTVAVLSVAMPPPMTAVVLGIDLFVVYQVVLNRTEWLASIPIAQARYSEFLSTAWDDVERLAQVEVIEPTELAEVRSVLTNAIRRVDLKEAPDRDWDRLRSESLSLMQLQLLVLDGNVERVSREEIGHRWSELLAHWRMTIDLQRRFI